ncbi:Ribose transport system permease protein RbsC [Tritonibacter multivorans]|uniref:Ribose transport system permease protein RbsC n=1 Tax=Tritonibacter multivorans TaxID=928856 RepID=A0A0P1GRL3_9RHOB|nr:ABC transporter permease [Tritonibacter multivorans]MDA7422233.1 ABC transporter permease [Tritonibacter multivorans]CUH77858.1 Ribose transport system permease protein RbsC [Tritonibacter multivorans]SFD10825.1 monosaccharide ABC transporter membrane protein, CUT2 family [Tritonibacter multivorans]
MSAVATNSTSRSLMERLEPYLAIIGPMVMILAILLFMGVAEPARYFRLSNLNLILLDAALYMPMAMAMTFVITQRGIDLSIGSIAALSGILMAFLIKQYGFPAYVAVPLALVLGALMGLINGLIITRFKVPDLIGTLAMDLVYRGLALVIAKGLVLARFPEMVTEIGRGQIPGFIPVPVVIGLLTMALGYMVLKQTHFGRYTIAIGSSPEASEMTGVAVDRHKVYAYVLMGACAALAGVMLTGKLNAIQATSAPYFNLHVIAAVVVGGTSLFGGRPSMVGSLAGVLLLSMMINALVTLRIEFFWQSVASGVVIVSSVALYTWIQKKDRDGALGLLASLRSKEAQRMFRFSAALLGALILLLAIGAGLAVDPTPSG